MQSQDNKINKHKQYASFNYKVFSKNARWNAAN